MHPCALRPRRHRWQNPSDRGATLAMAPASTCTPKIVPFRSTTAIIALLVFAEATARRSNVSTSAADIVTFGSGAAGGSENIVRPSSDSKPSDFGRSFERRRGAVYSWRSMASEGEQLKRGKSTTLLTLRAGGSVLSRECAADMGVRSA